MCGRGKEVMMSMYVHCYVLGYSPMRQLHALRLRMSLVDDDQSAKNGGKIVVWLVRLVLDYFTPDLYLLYISML